MTMMIDWALDTNKRTEGAHVASLYIYLDLEPLMVTWRLELLDSKARLAMPTTTHRPPMGTHPLS
jgi:hypothetical protein